MRAAERVVNDYPLTTLVTCITSAWSPALERCIFWIYPVHISAVILRSTYLDYVRYLAKNAFHEDTFQEPARLCDCGFHGLDVRQRIESTTGQGLQLQETEYFSLEARKIEIILT